MFYSPADIYLLKVNNKIYLNKVWNMFKVNNKDTKTTSDVVLLSLLLTLNIFLLILMLSFNR